MKMSEYDNNLQVIVSKVVSDKQNAPTLNVTVEIAGRKYSSGLWLWRRKDGSTVNDKHGNAMYKGKLKEWDSENPGAQRRGSPMSQPTPADQVFNQAHQQQTDAAKGYDAAAVTPKDFDDDIPF
jgi:hypothetical protein